MVCFILQAVNGHNLQLPAAIARGHSKGSGIRKGHTGAVNQVVVEIRRHGGHGKAIVEAKLGQGIDGVPEDIRYPDYGNGKAPKALPAVRILQKDRISHDDALATLAQGKGALEGNHIVFNAVFADLRPGAVAHQVHLGREIPLFRLDLVRGQLNALDVVGHLLFGNGFKMLQISILADENLFQSLGDGDTLLQLILHLIGVGDGVELGLGHNAFPACGVDIAQNGAEHG